MRESSVRFVLLLFATSLLVAQYRPARRSTGANTATTGTYGLPAVAFHGTIKSISGREIVILSDEKQEIEIHRTHKTKFLKDGKEIKAAGISAGAIVTLDVTKAPDASLQAVNVFVETAPPAGH